MHVEQMKCFYGLLKGIFLPWSFSEPSWNASHLQGFGDHQLAKLTSLLKQRRIWALNVGENFAVSLSAWADFTAALPDTIVSYIYVSEHKLRGTDLKNRMRAAIRYNRKVLGPRDPLLCANVTNMWFNPPAPGRSTAGQPLSVNAASDPKEAPTGPVVAARRNRDLERIESRRAALIAAGMPPPHTPDDKTALPATVANLKRFQFIDYLAVPASVHVTPPPLAPLHPAAAACILHMHHTVASAAPLLPSALDIQADSAIWNSRRLDDSLQILPLALPMEYVEKMNASPRSVASSAFRLEFGPDLSDMQAEVRSMDASGASCAGRCAAPVQAVCTEPHLMEPIRRSKRAIKKRSWADDSDDEATTKSTTNGMACRGMFARSFT